MKAVVMAGGEGTRLRPLTCNLPKPMVPVVNKPVIQHIIELLISHDIRDILVTLHYLPQEIINFLGDGSDLGARINYSIETEPLGTAGSVKKIESQLDDTFLIISGDALTDFDLSEIIRYHKDKKAVASIALARVENPLEFGVVITDSEGRIRRFLEKPGWGEVFSDTINTGIYVLEPAVLKLMEPAKSYDFSKDLFPILLHQSQPMFGYVSSGYWCDIGNLQQYRQAQHDALDGRVKVNMPGTRVRHDVWMGEGSTIDPRAEIQGPVVIGKNCQVNERATIHEYTSLGDNCIVEEGALLHRSVIWNNTYTGKKSKITGAIVSRSCTIKNNNVISEGAVIGDKCYIGAGAVIHPQVKIWPEKRIEAGANVSMSLVWGGSWPGSLFSNQGITGLANIEMTTEFAMKLGAAYGSSLEKACTLITSRDSHPASRMINRALICGLTSVGVHVLDYRFMPTPVSRYGIKNAQALGGTHVRLSPKDPHSLLIEFFDADGINVDKGFERKIENIFFREDFRRTGMEEVGDIEFSSRAIDQYQGGFHANIDGAAIKKENLKIVVDYGFGNASLVLPHLLGKLGTNLIALNAYTDPVRGRQGEATLSRSLKELSNIVVSLQANLGLWVDVDGEKFVLIDEMGKIISGYTLLNLMTVMMLKYHGEGTIVVPIVAPQTVERLCEQYGGKVKRTKNDPRSLMAEALADKNVLFAGDGEGGFIFPKFLPSFDAMFGFAKLLEIRTKMREPISKLLQGLPLYHMNTQTVECAWSDKGRIMRKIIEETKEERMELLEGVKLFLDSSKCVLVIPDPVEPMLHVIAEAESEMAAHRLARQYGDRIETLKLSESSASSHEHEIVRGGDIMPKKLETKKAEKKIDNGKGALKKEKKTQHPLSPEKAFYFWSDNHFLGSRAASLSEFFKVLETVEANSIRYHLTRGDFQNWLTQEFEEFELVEALNRLNAEQELEALRKEILRLVKARV